ncbi:putative fungal-specific transcription factor [Apodospora peruviana]|uniref:Fungal-specific transcription factor n=1 Tax=Apodospora peruviana TaxID=516989 RepID=A0AAE0HW91_9PEZI|nr:putative fungal-specific transcription factor [Apodospora peruviana]
MQRLTRAQAASRVACTICHQRKVRCDAHDVGIPCTNCRSASRADACRPHQKRKRIPKSATAVRSQPRPESSDAELASSSRPATGTTTTSVPPRHALSQTPLGIPPVVRVPIDASAEDGALLYKRHLVEFVDQPHIEERPIDKNARIAYIGTQVSNLNFLAGQHFGERTSRVCHYPTNKLDRRETCYEPDRLPVEAFQLPSRVVVDQLLDAYFAHVNPGFPVVDEDIFVAQYRARDPQNPPSLLLLHAILVVGAHVLFDPPERETIKATFFRRAKSLFDARFERNRDTIVQAALLLSWHADGPEDVAANAWFWIGVAVRTAAGLGMHRDADESTIVPHNKRMWRRVFWLLFQCDVLLSLQYGRPQSLHLQDSDVKPLQASDFQDCGKNTQVVYVVHTTKLCVIMSHGLRERFRLASTTQSRQDALRKLDDSLAQWSLQLPESLHMRPAASLDLWPACLQLHYNMALLLLHRSAPTDQQAVATREDAEICAMAASFIQSIFQGICDRGELRSLWLSVVNCIFTALIQLNVEVRTSNALVAVPALMRYDAAIESLRQLAEYWPNAQPILLFFESVRSSKRPGGQTERGSLVDHDVPPNSTEWPGRPPQQPVSQTAIPDINHMAEGALRMDVIMDPAAASAENNFVPPVAGPSSQHLSSGHHRGQQEQQLGHGVADFAEAWHAWRSTYWQQADLTDDFLFTF